MENFEQFNKFNKKTDTITGDDVNNNILKRIQIKKLIKAGKKVINKCNEEIDFYMQVRHDVIEINEKLEKILEKNKED